MAPTIREHVLSRRSRRSHRENNVIDIHSLLVAPDPSRKLSKSYKTLNLLGKGGFGSVYRVQYLPTGENRAIKVLTKPKDFTELKKVLTEVELLIELDHPNIEKFFEFYENSKFICLVTELCTGGHLGTLEPDVDMDEVRLLFRDVVSAVAYCHSKGVVHRDLKFENCLLTESKGENLLRFAKVIDFGLSAVRPMDECADRWMNEAVGTLYFVAPEVIKSEDWNHHKYGSKCDMWSIGIMLFISLTDEHPFVKSAAGTDMILHQVRKAPMRTGPLDDSEVDQTVRNLLFQMLEKEPVKRISAEAALRHDFFAPRRRWGDEGRTPRTSQKSLQSMLGRICSFRQFSRFERALLTLVAHDAQAKEVEDLRAAFVTLDTARAGWLSRDGIRSALKQRGINLPAHELEAALDALDPDGDDQIQYTDWLAATLQPSALTTDKAFIEIFDFFDIHGAGVVSKADLTEILGEEAVQSLPLRLDEEQADSLTREQFHQLIKQVATSLQEQTDSKFQRSGSKRKLRTWSAWLSRQDSCPGLVTDDLAEELAGQPISPPRSKSLLPERWRVLTGVAS